MSDSEQPLPFAARLWLAWAVFFRVLVDGLFAAHVAAVREQSAALPEHPEDKPLHSLPPPEIPPPAPTTCALQMLALLQREGRLVDFVEQDITSFSDADVGVAARVVHEGCRRALRAHATLAPVMRAEEGSAVTLEEGYNAAEIKLIGNVRGSAPFRGKLVHKGWRANDLTLPTLLDDQDAAVLAPAEVEL